MTLMVRTVRLFGFGDLSSRDRFARFTGGIGLFVSRCDASVRERIPSTLNLAAEGIWLASQLRREKRLLRMVWGR